jgi:virginiamycin B lyase
MKNQSTRALSYTLQAFTLMLTILQSQLCGNSYSIKNLLPVPVIIDASIGSTYAQRCQDWHDILQPNQQKDYSGDSRCYFSAISAKSMTQPLALWGVNQQGAPVMWFRQLNNWAPFAGTLSQISVSSDGVAVWGIDSAGSVYQFINSSFTKRPGSLISISVANASTIWGTDANEKIWKWNPAKNAWDLFPLGLLTQISASADGTVWGLNKAGKVYQKIGNDWAERPGKFSLISVGNATNIWAMESDGLLWNWSMLAKTWVARPAMPGTAAQISVGADGSVWGVNKNGNVYRWAINRDAWQQMPGELKYISVALGLGQEKYDIFMEYGDTYKQLNADFEIRPQGTSQRAGGSGSIVEINRGTGGNIATHALGTLDTGARWIGERFKNTKATRAADYGIRKAALESALGIATGVLKGSESVATGSMIAARETAKAAMTTAEQFLDKIVRNASEAVLKGPALAAQGILEGIKQGTLAVLEGGKVIITKGPLDMLDINEISYRGSLSDLKGGVLGNVHVKFDILKQKVDTTISLDPKKGVTAVYDGCKSAVNSAIDTLKRAVLDPFESKAQTIEQAAKPLATAQAQLASAPKELSAAVQTAQHANQQVQQEVSKLTATQSKAAADIATTIEQGNKKAEETLEKAKSALQAQNPQQKSV